MFSVEWLRIFNPASVSDTRILKTQLCVRVSSDRTRLISVRECRLAAASMSCWQQHDSSANPLLQPDASRGRAAKQTGERGGRRPEEDLTQDTGDAEGCRTGEASLWIRPSLRNPLMAFEKPCEQKKSSDVNTRNKRFCTKVQSGKNCVKRSRLDRVSAGLNKSN